MPPAPNANARLLLLPGLLCDARLWQAQVTALSGVASCTVAELTSGDNVAALAAAALEQAPPGRFALAGLSMGGYVAFEIMRQAPQRVTALALLDTSARPDTAEAKENRLKLIRTAKADFDAVATTLLPKLLHLAHLEDQNLVEIVRDMARHIGLEAFEKQQHAIMNRPDSRPLLTGIKCPTLILCGAQDVLTPPALHAEMADAIPGAQLKTIDLCGHLSSIEQPDQVTQALKQWLQQTETI